MTSLAQFIKHPADQSAKADSFLAFGVAIGSKIDSSKDKLFDARIGQRQGFLQNSVNRTRPSLAPSNMDDAVSARMIASILDLQ